MTTEITGSANPTRYAGFRICGLVLAAMFLFGAFSPASAAAVPAQPGLMTALGEPVAAIDAASPPELLLAGRGGRKARRGHRGGGRKAYRGRGYSKRQHFRSRGYSKRRHLRSRGYSKRRHFRSRKFKRRTHRGPSIHFSLPYYGYAPYYRSYSYRPYAGSCTRWRQRCAANWGYGNADFYGCMRYHGCR